MDRKPCAVISKLLKYIGLGVCIVLGIVSCTYRQVDNTEVSAPEILHWVQSSAAKVEVLTSEPAECLSKDTPLGQQHSIILGRAAFRSPYLLGGQAARRGMTCQACHTNGHINAHFFIEGLSQDPGTADVTNFHFSTTLGDDVFNPKPIPTLTTTQKLKTSDELQAQEKFILRLVEKEFDGEPPSQMVRDGLIAYVRALNAEACTEPMIANIELLDFRIAILTQELSMLSDIKVGDTQTRDFLRSAIRAELGRLHGRFPRSGAIRQKLIQLSQDIKRMSEIDSTINIQWLEVSSMMLQAYPNSLFSPSFATKWYAD